jgi:hypothetical protein
VFFALLYICILHLSAQSCITKLNFCLLCIDDRQQFFKALEQVSCGGQTIEHFFKFTDKAANIVNGAKGNDAGAGPKDGND